VIWPELLMPVIRVTSTPELLNASEGSRPPARLPFRRTRGRRFAANRQFGSPILGSGGKENHSRTLRFRAIQSSHNNFSFRNEGISPGLSLTPVAKEFP
jgi:hypothetical protein